MRSHKMYLGLIFLVLVATACTNWEQTTYQTLSASKAVIDQAGADYNAGLLPKTSKVRDSISRAREVQTAAVQDFETYAVAKLTGEPSATLDQKRLAIMQTILSVNQVVLDVQALYREVKK